MSASCGEIARATPHVQMCGVRRAWRWIPKKSFKVDVDAAWMIEAEVSTFMSYDGRRSYIVVVVPDGETHTTAVVRDVAVKLLCRGDTNVSSTDYCHIFEASRFASIRVSSEKRVGVVIA
jgi:hypothetical protein